MSRCQEDFGAELTPGERFRIEQGIEIGRRARSLYPGGRLTSLNMTAALKETKEALADESVSAIYEGAFLADSFAARADVLEPPSFKARVPTLSLNCASSAFSSTTALMSAAARNRSFSVSVR